MIEHGLNSSGLNWYWIITCMPLGQFFCDQYKFLVFNNRQCVRHWDKIFLVINYISFIAPNFRRKYITALKYQPAFRHSTTNSWCKQYSMALYKADLIDEIFRISSWRCCVRQSDYLTKCKKIIEFTESSLNSLMKVSYMMICDALLRKKEVTLLLCEFSPSFLRRIQQLYKTMVLQCWMSVPLTICLWSVILM